MSGELRCCPFCGEDRLVDHDSRHAAILLLCLREVVAGRCPGARPVRAAQTVRVVHAPSVCGINLARQDNDKIPAATLG